MSVDRAAKASIWSMMCADFVVTWLLFRWLTIFDDDTRPIAIAVGVAGVALYVYSVQIRRGFSYE